LNNFQHFLFDYHTETFQKGEVLLHQDTKPSHALVVKSGIIKVYNLTSQGEEIAVDFASKNDLLPIGWVFGRLHKTQYYYEALTDCEVYSIPRKELLAFLKANPDSMLVLLQQAAQDSMNQAMHVNALGQLRARDKVLYAIHYFALCFGRDLHKDVVHIPLPLTQQDIANFTGLTRRTIGYELKHLASIDVVFKRQRKYVVLTDKLNELLDDEYNNHVIR